MPWQQWIPSYLTITPCIPYFKWLPTRRFTIKVTKLALMHVCLSYSQRAALYTVWNEKKWEHLQEPPMSINIDSWASVYIWAKQSPIQWENVWLCKDIKVYFDAHEKSWFLLLSYYRSRRFRQAGWALWVAANALLSNP